MVETRRLLKLNRVRSVITAFEPNYIKCKFTNSYQSMPPHTDLIYMISCDKGNIPGCHVVPAYRDAPVAFEPSDRSTRSHLKGKVPVLDLEAFMENETDDIAFIIIRTIKCSEASVMIARAGGPLRWTEDIYTKSKISKIAMQQVATCYFQPNFEETKPSHPYSTHTMSLRNITAPFERNRIVPADLFFFHHRHLLRTYALEHSESRQHIDALLEYVDNRYGMEFAEAESLIEGGMVTQAHILNLFRPNEFVMSGTYGRPAAFVLQEWPKLTSDGWVTLSCWSFQADGSGFARKRSYLSIPPLYLNTTEIQNLIAYPLRFATPELREVIQNRGKKQWELRTATQVTYKGWNVGRDQYYVSPKQISSIRIFR